MLLSIVQLHRLLELSFLLSDENTSFLGLERLDEASRS